MFVVWGILGLSFLVFFHELGHFVAARIFGVQVEAFSVGMGPVLLHRTYKGTDYRLSLIPIGGYCAMKGEQDYQKALDSNSSVIEADSDSFCVSIILLIHESFSSRFSFPLTFCLYFQCAAIPYSAV